MAHLFQGESARRLGLPGRSSLEIVSALQGPANLTLRRVEIAVPSPGEPPRNRHVHRDFAECIFVVAGEGVMWAGDERHTLRPGDAVVVPAGEPHVTRNTGSVPLELLCFFPVGDVAAGTFDIET